MPRPVSPVNQQILGVLEHVLHTVGGRHDDVVGGAVNLLHGAFEGDRGAHRRQTLGGQCRRRSQYEPACGQRRGEAALRVVTVGHPRHTNRSVRVSTKSTTSVHRQ
jgi:hypothetical protein